MPHRKVHSQGTYAHFVTFSCQNRRRLLDPDICKRVVIGTLASQLKLIKSICIGFVIMPDHVHALVWFPDENQISPFMDKWKELTSKQILNIFTQNFPSYLGSSAKFDSVWQDRYYGFNIHSDEKLREKLTYMHENPVRAGIAKEACEWPWSSARFWLKEESVGIQLGWPG